MFYTHKQTKVTIHTQIERIHTRENYKKINTAVYKRTTQQAKEKDEEQDIPLGREAQIKIDKKKIRTIEILKYRN